MVFKPSGRKVPTRGYIFPEVYCYCIKVLKLINIPGKTSTRVVKPIKVCSNNLSIKHEECDNFLDRTNGSTHHA